MGVILIVCAAFGLTIQRSRLRSYIIARRGCRRKPQYPAERHPARCTTKRTSSYTWGNFNHNITDLSIEVDRYIRNAWCSFRKYTLELYDRPSVPLELITRKLRAGVLETMLYGCVKWSPRACHHDSLRRGHYSFLTRCIARRENNGTDLPISYLDTLMKTGSESVDAMMRRRRKLFAGFVARMDDTKLPNCLMLGGLVGSGLRGGEGKTSDGVSPG